MKKNYRKPPSYAFTLEGLEKIKKEKEELQNQRPDAVEHLRRAREMGDLSENGYYKASKSKLITIDNRISHLTHLIKYTKIIQAANGEKASLGSTITVTDGKTQAQYMIVGAYESNPAEGKISNVSPLGRALLGKEIGEQAEITTPSGTKVYKIIKLK